MGEHQFFFELMVILLSARLLAALSLKLGAPIVIGELLAGVVLGPSLLGWMEPNDMLQLLAEIGVTLLLFEVGLETDIARIIRTGPKSVVVATAGFVLPFSFGFAVTYWLFDASLLVAVLVGGTLTATSTGITVRILSELNRQRSSEGQIIIGAAVVDDVLGVLLLVLVHEFATEGTVDWMKAGQILISVVAFFVFAPFISHPMMWAVRRLEELGRIPGLLPTLIVSLVFFFAWVASLVGAPAILGGLAAGLALSRRFFSPIGVVSKTDQDFAYRVETQMKPIIHLFTPIFFVVVGLSLNLNIVKWQEPFVWAFLTTFFVLAVLTKLIGPLLIRESWLSRLMIGAAMVPRGEVGLIFAEMGRNGGALTDDVYAALVLIVALTTLLPPFFMKWLHASSDKEHEILRLAPGETTTFKLENVHHNAGAAAA